MKQRYGFLKLWSSLYNNIITLDWDIQSEKEIKKRVDFIRSEFPDAVIRVRQSAFKGHHCLVILQKPVDQFYYRRRWRDDGVRLVADIFRTVGPDYNDIQILWDKKFNYYRKDGTLMEWPAGKWISH